MLASRFAAVLSLSSLQLLVLSPRSSTAADWQIDAGAGVISAPRSLGSGRQLTIPVSVIEARYRDWFFATDNPTEGIAAGAVRGRAEYETHNRFSSLTVSERLAVACGRMADLCSPCDNSATGVASGLGE